ncbi:MAG: S8/S53 family peptidase, partial [Bacteroidales bacterium]|nr:S8/S53 family peptidase [Bacteroidales bacterium]
DNWLSKVYIVTSDETFISDLRQANFGNAISNIEEIPEPQLCYTPNDYSLAWSQTDLDLIKAKEAWDIIGSIPRIPIGVTDQPFDTTHPDLCGQFIDVIGKGYATDYHGTSVSGILGAITNNGIGLSSVSLGAKIYASNNYVSSEVLKLAQLGCKVINCSWTYRCHYIVADDTLYRQLRDDWNTVVVFAAGNNPYPDCGAAGLGGKAYPASYPSVLSVTSIGHAQPIGSTGKLYGLDNWADCFDAIIGDSTSGYMRNSAVDVCAPGYKVPVLMDATSGGYDAQSGTSFAAPLVTATVCLMRSINPCLSAVEVMQMVKDAADTSIYSIPYNQRYRGRLGTGRLDVAKSCLLAAQTATKTLNVPTIFNSSTIVKANYAIKNTSSVLVKNSANVQFKARHNIELNAGFEVELGAIFSAEIDPNLTVSCE